MNKIIAVFLVALCMTVCVTAYSDGVQADLQDNLIRLHIIAVNLLLSIFLITK